MVIFLAKVKSNTFHVNLPVITFGQLLQKNWATF